eukprot:867963-Rhodomonas_salina.1
MSLPSESQRSNSSHVLQSPPSVPYCRRKQLAPSRQKAKGNDKVWLQKLELKDHACDALAVLHHTHNPVTSGVVLTTEQIRKVILPSTMAHIQSHFRKGNVAPMRALWMKNGFLLDFNSRDNLENGFVGSLFVNIAPSKLLNSSFVTALITSREMYIPFHRIDNCNCKARGCSQCSIAEVLDRTYTGWRNVGNEKPMYMTTTDAINTDTKCKHNTRLTVGMKTDTKIEHKPSETSCNQLDAVVKCCEMACKDKGRRHQITVAMGNDTTMNFAAVKGDHLRVYATTKRGGVETECTAKSAVLGWVAEQRIEGVYTYGVRSLVCAAMQGVNILPTVYEAKGLHDDLSNTDCVIQAIRAMELVSSLDPCESTENLFKVLNIAHVSATKEQQSLYSVYPVHSRVAVAPLLCDTNKPTTKTWTHRSVMMNDKKTQSAILAAYAVFTQKLLFQNVMQCSDTGTESTPNTAPRTASKTKVNTVLVDGPVLQTQIMHSTDTHDTTLEMNAMKRESASPMLTMQWYGYDVTLSRNVEGTLFFSDEADNTFAVSGHVSRCDHEPRTEYVEALLAGRDTPSFSPVATVFEDIHGDSLRHAAIRLAYVDTLCAMSTQFKPHWKKLRGIWLHSEKERSLCDTQSPLEYTTRMCTLAQMAYLPLQVNYWSTVPYLKDEACD